jgi:cell division protein FtsQ
MRKLTRPNRRRRSLKEKIGVSVTFAVAALRRVVPILCLIFVAVALPSVCLQAYAFVISSPYFAVETVEVAGLDKISHEELLVAAGIEVGSNIFDIHEDRVRMRVLTHPWIKNVEVNKRLPDVVTIRIVERLPAAVAVGENHYFVGAGGDVIKQLEFREWEAVGRQLPLISGLQRVERPTAEEKNWIRDALEVVRMYRLMGLGESEKLSQVHVDKVMGISLMTVGGTEVSLGWGRYEERVNRLRLVMKSLESWKDVGYVLADSDDLGKVTVGPRGATAQGVEAW